MPSVAFPSKAPEKKNAWKFIKFFILLQSWIVETVNALFQLFQDFSVWIFDPLDFLVSSCRP